MIPFPHIIDISQINNETIIFYTEEKAYICYITQNQYKINKILNFKEEILQILILKDNRILIRGYETFLFLNGIPPYNVIKEKIFW